MIAVFCFVMLALVVLVIVLLVMQAVDDTSGCIVFIALCVGCLLYAGIYWLSFGFQRLYHAPDAVAVEKGGRP